MGLTGYQVLVVLAIIANFKACPRKVAKDSEWVSKPQETTQAPEKDFNQADQDGFKGEFHEEGFREQERNIPKDIQALTDLLEAVVGTHNEEYFDPYFDTLHPSNQSEVIQTPSNQSASLLDGRPKRMVGSLIASLIPQLSKFGGGLFKSILSQLIYRGGDPSYKQGLLARFIPRVLSQTSLGNSQTEQVINQQIKSRNYLYYRPSSLQHRVLIREIMSQMNSSMPSTKMKILPS